MPIDGNNTDMVTSQQSDRATDANLPKPLTDKVPPPYHRRRTNSRKTQAKARSLHPWEGACAEKHIILSEELGYAVPEVPAISYIEAFLPSWKTGIDIDTASAALREIDIIQENGRCSSFPQDPKLYGGENVVFHRSEGIFNKVVETAVQQTSDPNQTFILLLLPDAVPEPERSGRTRPDGCVVLKVVEGHGQEGAVVYQWYDIPLTCEFRLQIKENWDKSVTQIVHCMQRTMTLDPCKRFTFGIAIENTDLRLWFSSRSVMVISEPFNSITESELLARVYLPLAFTSKAELGWDPTIWDPDPNTRKRVDQIEANGSWYEVLQALSDFGADAIFGRVVTVFRAKLVSSDEVYVLKDAWVEDDRELEYTNYKMVREDFGSTFNENTRSLVASHLLTPIDNWLVTVHSQEYHTKYVMMCGRGPSHESSFKHIASVPATKVSSKSITHMKSADKEVLEELNAHLGPHVPPDEPRTTFRHRRHYRVVFKETETPIWTVTVPSDLFTVLRDCATALNYIHKSGWIHREISAGNVYSFDGGGLIGGLEYARNVTTGDSHQMRTGAPDFMAVEVMRNSYLHLPTYDYSESKALTSDENDAWNHYVGTGGDKHVSFIQNEAHDIESLWWIAIHTLFFNGDVNLLSEESKERRHARHVWALRIFPGAVAMNRDSFFRDEGNFKEGVGWLPSSFDRPVMRLFFLRGTLARAYYEFEKKLPYARKKAFRRLQATAISVLNRCAKYTIGVDVSPYGTLGRVPHQAPSQTT